MPRTRIKICGICRPEDARAAANAGADAIGLVFHREAGRYVSPEQALEIIANLPAMVSIVGVFVDATAAEIRRIVELVPLSAIQLHGNESPHTVADLQPLKVLRAIEVDANISKHLADWREAIERLWLTNLSGIVLETSGGGAPGGTGAANDWELIQKLQAGAQFSGLPPIIAAGGLTPENVGEVVRKLRPWAVDVSSGVESGRRMKSAEKIEAFVRAVRAADDNNG
jgi:phosphoribosylanthranilate isomerase